MNPVCVTGIGVVSAIGMNVAENMAAFRNGRSGLGRVARFSTRLDVPVGEVKCTDEELRRKLGVPFRIASRTALLGMLAAREAMNDASVDVRTQRVGLISATSVGGMDTGERFYPHFRTNPDRGGRLRDVRMYDCGASTEAMADYLGIAGFVTTVSTACSSAANAILLGARMIRAGLLDTVVAGGTDALCRFTLNGFHSLGILDREGCRPFDNTRAGLNLGEGAGYLVLQSERVVRNVPYCLLTGYANINEAYHQTGTSPDGDGAYRAMREALRVAGVRPEEVDYVNVHGTGTPGNDLSESNALRRLFGERVPRFSSVKPFIGHTLGASEGIEAVYSVWSVAHGAVYPNLHFAHPMEETGLVPVTMYAEGFPVKHVLSNAFGFGGNDSSLLFSALTYK